MSKQTEALKLALEALELVTWTNNPPVNKAIVAIRQALADAEQPAPASAPVSAQPDHIEDVLAMVAQTAQEPDPDELTIAYLNGIDTGKKRKPWVGLTNKEISEIHDAAFGKNIGVATGLVEKKLKEKNQ